MGSGASKLSNDPLLIEKVRDIVGLYLHRREGIANVARAWSEVPAALFRSFQLHHPDVASEVAEHEDDLIEHVRLHVAGESSS